MVDYLGSCIVFMAALLAVKGGTWSHQRKGIKKITKTGWATISISFIGLIVSYWSVRAFFLFREFSGQYQIFAEKKEESVTSLILIPCIPFEVSYGFI